MQRRGCHLARLPTTLLAVGWLVAACALPVGEALRTGPAAPSAEAPTASAPASPSGPSRPFRPTPTPAPTFAAYVVRRGDTLIGLARRLGTSPESLAYWNRARYPSLDPDAPAYRPDRIEAGWELVYLPGAVVDPENLPPASGAPSAGPGSSPSVGPYPTLPADGSAALVRRGPAGLAGVALTFEYSGGADAGAGGAGAIVQWLAANGVPATVFVAPRAAAPDDPAAVALLARLAATRTVTFGLLASTSEGDELATALRAADAALAPALGRSTVPWLRPAAGDAGAATLLAAGRAGWTWVVTWDVDPGDAVAPGDGGPVAADIVTRVVARASGGSIVRLQLGGARTLESLPGIVDGLAARGLTVLSLAEVLGLGEAAPGG